MPPLHAHLPLRVRVWFAGPALDRRLAVGEDPFSDPALALRAAALLSKRACQTIVRGLERVMSEEPKQRGLSASVAVGCQAVEIARPALGQLALALRSRDLIRPQGVALAQTLLTDPCSALYHAEPTDRLYENAREALIALSRVPPRRRPRRKKASRTAASPGNSTRRDARDQATAEAQPRRGGAQARAQGR